MGLPLVVGLAYGRGEETSQGPRLTFGWPFYSLLCQGLRRSGGGGVPVGMKLAKSLLLGLMYAEALARRLDAVLKLDYLVFFAQWY